MLVNIFKAKFLNQIMHRGEKTIKTDHGQKLNNFFLLASL